MKIHGCITQNDYEPVSTFNKRPFCLSYFESCNFKRVKRKEHILTTILAKERYRFPKSSVLALYMSINHKDLNVKSLVYVSGLRNNCLHATKMYYTTVQNCNLMSRGKHLNFQPSV